MSYTPFNTLSFTPFMPFMPYTPLRHFPLHPAAFLTRNPQRATRNYFHPEP